MKFGSKQIQYLWKSFLLSKECLHRFYTSIRTWFVIGLIKFNIISQMNAGNNNVQRHSLQMLIYLRLIGRLLLVKVFARLLCCFKLTINHKCGKSRSAHFFSKLIPRKGSLKESNKISIKLSGIRNAFGGSIYSQDNFSWT